MISVTTILTFIGMATVTYCSRILGYLLLGNRNLSPRAKAVMDVAPGCVLISVIAPHFVSSRPEEIVALVITLLAASRLSMLATVVIAVSSLDLLKNIFN